MHLVPFRYLTFIATTAIFVLSLFYYDHYWLPVLAGALTLVGISDLLQTKRALRRKWCSIGSRHLVRCPGLKLIWRSFRPCPGTLPGAR